MSQTVTLHEITPVHAILCNVNCGDSSRLNTTVSDVFHRFPYLHNVYPEETNSLCEHVYSRLTLDTVFSLPPEVRSKIFRYVPSHSCMRVTARVFMEDCGVLHAGGIAVLSDWENVKSIPPFTRTCTINALNSATGASHPVIPDLTLEVITQSIQDAYAKNAADGLISAADVRRIRDKAFLLAPEEHLQWCRYMLRAPSIYRWTFECVAVHLLRYPAMFAKVLQACKPLRASRATAIVMHDVALRSRQAVGLTALLEHIKERASGEVILPVPHAHAVWGRENKEESLRDGVLYIPSDPHFPIVDAFMLCGDVFVGICTRCCKKDALSADAVRQLYAQYDERMGMVDNYGSVRHHVIVYAQPAVAANVSHRTDVCEAAAARVVRWPPTAADFNARDHGNLWCFWESFEQYQCIVDYEFILLLENTAAIGVDTGNNNGDS